MAAPYAGMRLEELARTRPFAAPVAAPGWTQGCFRRRCITYATGAEDYDTQAIRLQSHNLTGEIRVPKERPGLAGRQSLADCSRDELAALAQSEGTVSETLWRDGQMYWTRLAAFQPYEKWPEPGLLGRVGSSLIEWAPSGVYVQDWRAQPRSSGLAAGLRLVSETGLDGVERDRAGGLVIAGDHAVMVLGRRSEVPKGRAHELLAAGDWKAMAKSLFETEAAYAMRSDGDYRITLAVDPFANGRVLFAADGFEPGAVEGELYQRPAPHEAFSLRRWRIDTLLAGQSRPRSTPAKPPGTAWLEAERETLFPRR